VFPESTPRLSVAVAATETTGLERCLDALGRQTRAGGVVGLVAVAGAGGGAREGRDPSV
jgi:hypothetical protein